MKTLEVAAHPDQSQRGPSTLSEMTYLRWVAGAPLQFVEGSTELWTEVDAQGYTHREIAFDRAGQEVHRKPSLTSSKFGEFGIFDGPPLNPATVVRRGIAVEVSQETFEDAWSTT